jgi:putative ABC transport system permease protein
LARWLLERLLPADEREFVLGDLEEIFAAAVRTGGAVKARRRYRQDALAALRALTMRRRGTPAATWDSERRGDGTMLNLLQDVRFGFRLLSRRPGFTAVAVLTLALGIGANTAIFTIAHTLLLERLPFPAADRLAIVLENNLARGWARFSVSPGNFLEWRSTASSFDALAAYGTVTLNYRGSDAPEQLRALSGSEGFLEMLGGTPALGRGFLQHEFSPGREQVAILSHGFWLRGFGGRADVVGQALTLNGLRYEIVGVMHPAWTFGGRAIDLFVPRAFTEGDREARGGHYLVVIGRTRPGVTTEQAQTEMSSLAARLGQQYPDTNAGWDIVVTPLREAIVGQVRPMLLLLLSAVGLLLLIACANVANMLLARATVRAREMAVRRAIGAGTGRIVRQLLTESVVLAVTGGALGVLLAHWGLKTLLTAHPNLLPRSSAMSVDGTVLGFTTLLAVTAAVVFGLAPALWAARSGLLDSLREGAPGGSGGRFRRGLRSGLVVGEVALALVLLMGAGLLGKSYARLARVEPGFATIGRLTARTVLPAPKYEESARITGFYHEAVERLASLPGVESVALASTVPISGNDELYSIEFEGRPPLPPGQGVSALYYLVSPGYFETMGIPIVQGRAFTDADRDGTPRVAIVNDEFVRLHYPGDNPIGRRIRMGRDSTIAREIVGVVGSVKHYGLDDRAQAQMYEPFAQMPATTMNFLLKTSVDPTSLTASVRRQIQQVDPEQPVIGIATLEDLVAGSTAQPRVQTALLGLFAGVALVLAAVGLYGVMSYVVSQRTREIGIRMALGARGGSVLALVLRQALALTAAGLIVGAGAAVVTARALSSTLEPMLFQVDPADATVMLAVSAGLAAVAILATLMPARRAVRVDPIRALRAE